MDLFTRLQRDAQSTEHKILSLPKYINLPSNSGTKEVINVTDSLFCNWQITVVNAHTQNFLDVLISQFSNFVLIVASNCTFTTYIYPSNLKIINHIPRMKDV